MPLESVTLSGSLRFVDQFVDLGPSDHSCLSASFRYVARACALAGFIATMVKLILELYLRGPHSIHIFPAAVLAAISLCVVTIADLRFALRTKLIVCVATGVLVCVFLFWQRVGPQSHVFGGKVALTLVALVFALALSATHKPRFVRLGQTLAIILPFGYSLFLVFDLALDGKIAFSGLPPSLALAFFLNSVAAVIAVPDEGPIAVFTMDSAAAEIGRRLVPAVMIIILLTAWIRYQGERSGMYSAEVGVCLFAVASILLFAAVMQRTSETLSSALELSQEAARVADRDRERLEKRVQELEEQLERTPSTR
jgi:hypothetical protein